MLYKLDPRIIILIIASIGIFVNTIYEFKQSDWFKRIGLFSMSFTGLFLSAFEIAKHIEAPQSIKTSTLIGTIIFCALFLTMLTCSGIKKYIKGAKEPRRLR